MLWIRSYLDSLVRWFVGSVRPTCPPSVWRKADPPLAEIRQFITAVECLLMC